MDRVMEDIKAGRGLRPLQEAKADAGKLKISLVPGQIIKDIAQVRMYGNEKYHDTNNWRTVEMERYIDALLRHTLEFVKDINSKDEESGIEHYKHMACNMAFICEMMKTPEPRTNRHEDCQGCKYTDMEANEEPCKSCRCAYISKWEARK